MSWFNQSINAEQFLAEYWQQKPYLFRNAFSDITPLLPADELAGLACEENVESRLITHSSDHNDWQLQHGPFNDEIFSQLPESHWTLLLQAVDHWLPEATEFLTQFNFIPNWRIDDLMISYASDGGGVGPHFDHYDVFLIQASGQRKWEIGGRYDENSPHRQDTPVMILEDWQPKESWILNPGDMLYLPPQLGHNGIAVGDDCMTYSVGFRAPSYSDVLTSFTDYLNDQLSGSDRFTGNSPSLSSNPGEIPPILLNQLSETLSKLVTRPDDLINWFGQYASMRKYAEDPSEVGIACSEQDILNHIENGGIFCCSEGSRFMYYDTQDNRLLFVDGNNFTCPQTTYALIEKLCRDRQVDFETAQPNNDEILLLIKLIKQASIYPLLLSDTNS